MTEFLRVRLPESGAEVTLSADYVAGLDEGVVEVLDAPATNPRGVPLAATRKNGRRVKPRTTVRKEAAKRAAKKSASSPDDHTQVGVADAMPEEAPK